MALPSPTPFAPSGVNGEGVSIWRMAGAGTSHAVGDEIIGERAGEEAPVRGVGQLLVQGRSDPVREPAADLAIDEGGVQARAGVVHGDVLVDPRPVSSTSTPHMSKMKP